MVAEKRVLLDSSSEQEDKKQKGVKQDSEGIDSSVKEPELVNMVDSVYNSLSTSSSVMEINEEDVVRFRFRDHVDSIVMQLKEDLSSPEKPENGLGLIVVKPNDDINKQINKAYVSIKEENKGVLFVAQGKGAQKLTSIVEIVKQKICSGEEIVLLNKKKQNIQESINNPSRKFEKNQYIQYNRLTYFKTESTSKKKITKKETKQTRREKLLKVLDPAHQKEISVPVFSVVLQNVESIDHSKNDYKNLKLIGNKWTIQTSM